MNKTAQLNLYSLSAYVPFGRDEVACGFVLAAYDEEDARDEVREFVGESTSIPRFDPVLTIGLAGLDIEHGIIHNGFPFG